MGKINIIIPASGLGERFKAKGYNRFKPFIFIDNNETMIEKIIIGFQSKKYEVNIYIIIRSEIFNDYEQEIINLEKKYKNVHFKVIDYFTEGTVCTILSQYDLLNNNDPLLLANCDQLANINIDDYLDESLLFDGSLLVFRGTNDKNWSFVDIKNGLISKVADKQAITDIALLGWYFWKRASDFIKYSIELIVRNDRTKNEFMQNKPYNYAIKDGLKIKPIFIDIKDIIPLGTPEELEKYLKLKNK